MGFSISGGGTKRCKEKLARFVLIPAMVVTGSDLMPGSDSDAMPVAIGAKRR